MLCVVGIAGSSSLYAQTQSDVDARRAQLEAELRQLEKQIESQRSLVQEKQREATSLERDIAILDAQIEKSRLEIRARNIAIEKLGDEIYGKNVLIGKLDGRIDRQRRSLAQLLRKTRELDSVTLVEVAFTSGSLSDFFKDVDQFEAIESGLQKSFNELRTTRDLTEEEKAALEEKRQQEEELKQLQVLEQARIEEREAEKAELLRVTRGEEAEYKKLLAAQEKTAAEIRAELFRLRGSAPIPFGEALDHANFVFEKTGVRPAFLLGILAEETNLGANLGTGTWSVDMHPTRDQPVFKYITDALGLDPDAMPVSKKPSYGWGGAMGPAQFIPSTWVCYGGFVNVNTGSCGKGGQDITWKEVYAGPWRYEPSKDRIRELLGKASPSNPWNPRDAFMAAGLLLRENGAAAGGYQAERLAALRYFAGWVNASKPAYAFYGDDVMALAEKYQRQIDILQGN